MEKIIRDILTTFSAWDAAKFGAVTILVLALSFLVKELVAWKRSRKNGNGDDKDKDMISAALLTEVSTKVEGLIEWREAHIIETAAGWATLNQLVSSQKQLEVRAKEDREMAEIVRSDNIKAHTEMSGKLIELSTLIKLVLKNQSDILVNGNGKA